MNSFIMPDPTTKRYGEIARAIGLGVTTRPVPGKPTASAGRRTVAKPAPPAQGLTAEERKMIESLGVSEAAYIAERAKAKTEAVVSEDTEQVKRICAELGISLESYKKAKEANRNEG